MKQYIEFNPVKSLAALGLLIQAIIVLVALLAAWSPEVILAVEGIQAAALAFVASFFVASKAVSVKALESLQAALDAEGFTGRG